MNPQDTLPPIIAGSQIRKVPPIVSGAEHSSAPMARPNANEAAQTNPKQNAQSETDRIRGNSVLSNPLRPIQQPQVTSSGQPTSNPTVSSTPAMTRPAGTRSTLPQATNRVQPGQAISASGVPYYSSSEPQALPPFRVEQPDLPGSNLRPSGVQESVTESVLNGVTAEDPAQAAAAQLTQQPAAQQPAVEQPAVQQPLTTEGMPSVMAPRSETEGAQLPGAAAMDPRMRSRGTPDASGAGVAGARDYFEMDPNQAAFTPGCQDCLAAGGAANCPTCNANGSLAMSGAENSGAGNDQISGYFGAISRARRYAELDLLYITRTDGSIVFSNFGGLGAFDWGGGLRFTIGRRDDETQGQELSYFGTSDISKSVDRTDPGFRLNALFVPVGIIDGSLVAPFFGANIQNEQMETQVHSFELNKVDWAWDVVKSFWGFRFIYLDDSYTMFSQRGVSNAELELSSQNLMIGGHFGREWFYDVGYRFSFSGLGKLGLYANANQFEVDIANNGTQFFSNQNDSSTFSTSLDFALTGHYQINRRARLRAGYQFLLLNDIYSISDNLTGTLSPYYGDTNPSEDSMIFQGFSFGLELYR